MTSIAMCTCGHSKNKHTVLGCRLCWQCKSFEETLVRYRYSKGINRYHHPHGVVRSFSEIKKRGGI